MPPLEAGHPLDSDGLQSTAMTELVSLGWVEKVSDDIRLRVSNMITLLMNDLTLRACLEAPEPDLLAALGNLCNARRNRLDNHRDLRQAKLAEIGVCKSEQESLAETLYPIVYLQVLEQANLPVFDWVRGSFEICLASENRFTKKAMLVELKEHLTRAQVRDDIRDNLTEGIEKCLTRVTGRKRLGELLYPYDPLKLSEWIEKFPHASEVEIQAQEVESLVPLEQIVSKFLSNTRYFAGNPHLAPGFFTTFRSMWPEVVGSSQVNHVNLENTSNTFLVNLRGKHRINITRVRDFIDQLQSEWAKKYPSEPPLKIRFETRTDGGSSGGWIDI